MHILIETEKQRKEREHQEDLQRIRGFRPIDDDFMRSLFRNNKQLVELVLRIILKKNDLMLDSFETQADMNRMTGARSICLDAYASDNTGRKYDIEIQRADNGAVPHRARYHSSVMDIENLKKGQQFDMLPDTYTIFITENDSFKEQEPVYQIQRMNLTTEKSFGDGFYILYVNGEYRGDSDIGRLMHDFNCSNLDDMMIDLLAQRTRYFKETPEGVREMCKEMEKMRDKSRAEGRVEGIEEGEKNKAKEVVLNLYKMNMDVEAITKIANVSIDMVKEWISTDFDHYA